MKKKQTEVVKKQQFTFDKKTVIELNILNKIYGGTNDSNFPGCPRITDKSKDCSTGLCTD
jgi:hypothetical protein